MSARYRPHGSGRATRRLLLSALLLTALAPAAPPASARAAGGRTVETVATSLDSPRGVAITRAGVLVAEAGRGGTGPCVPGPVGFDMCLGMTGAVTLARDGGQCRVLTGLPSLYSAGLHESIGPYDVLANSSGQLLVSIGLGTHPAHRAALGPAGSATGQVVLAEPDGRWRPLVDIAGMVDPGLPESSSQPWGLHAGPGRTYVADANANVIHSFDPQGQISTFATLNNGSQPTTVARGPDGALYVGEFALDAPGHARVLRFAPGAPATVHATGFTNVVDIAFGPQGQLYVLEFAKNGVMSGDPTGRLVELRHDGTRVEIAPGRLTNPMSVAVSGAGDLYISNKGISLGEGELLRVRQR